MIDEEFATPRAQTIEALRRCPGDVIVLGAGGKMGPSLTLMLRRTADALDDGRQIMAVSRWSDAAVGGALQARGIRILRADLSSRDQVLALPDAPNVIYMMGQKFGTSAAPHATWAVNVLAPSYSAERYAGRRVVAFSTGNVYPLVPVAGGGAREEDPLGPIGDYAWSCVGRERMFEFGAARDGTRVVILRLNYAVELRYGVLLDIAARVRDGRPIPLAMGHVNVIWQEDANRVAIESLPHAATLPFVLNVTGAETLSVRDLAIRFGRRLGVEPVFEGVEQPTALLSNTERMQGLFGTPSMALDDMMDRVAEWVRTGGETLGKPTHFETRDGRF